MDGEAKDALGEFSDPLENYDPKLFSDPIARSLAEQTVSAIKSQPFATVPPDVSVEKAINELAGLQVACILVVEDGKLLGVFTDRDVLHQVALEYEHVKWQNVRNFMTPDPVFVYETDPAAAALSVMAVCGFRHVPVVDVNENVVGIVSPQRVTEFLKTQFGQARG